MARRTSKRNPRVDRFEPDGGERRRSLEVPLLWLGVAAFVGYPMLRDATSDRMQRNRYGSDQFSCECDYGPGNCSLREGSWAGPWYAEDAADRKHGDPGIGACRERERGYYRTAYAGVPRPDPAYRSPASVDAGYRGGVGGSGRVRAAGS